MNEVVLQLQHDPYLDSGFLFYNTVIRSQLFGGGPGVIFQKTSICIGIALRTSHLVYKH